MTEISKITSKREIIRKVIFEEDKEGIIEILEKYEADEISGDALSRYWDIEPGKRDRYQNGLRLLVETHAEMGSNPFDFWEVTFRRIHQAEGRSAAADWIEANFSNLPCHQRTYRIVIKFFVFCERLQQARAYLDEALVTWRGGEFSDILPMLYAAEGDFEKCASLIPEDASKRGFDAVRAYAGIAKMTGRWNTAKKLLESLSGNQKDHIDKRAIAQIDTFISISGRDFEGELPVYVIADIGSPRFRRVSQCLKRFGLPFQTVPPIYGSALPTEALKTLSRRQFSNQAEMEKLVGTFLSHAKIWELVRSREQRRALVLEDDAVLCVHPSVALTANGAKDYDFLFVNERMEHSDLLPIGVPQTIPLPTLIEQKKPRVIGADMYVLNDRCADGLLREMQSGGVVMHVDSFIAHFGMKQAGSREGLKFGCSLPAIGVECAKFWRE
ncbi:glycosyltransferase family 25 protein [Teichococcus rhizosphaerae]|nr:glycosyltransferase family 25 protein [Pseudoroseomonas rhizosphaerae]